MFRTRRRGGINLFLVCCLTLLISRATAQEDNYDADDDDDYDGDIGTARIVGGMVITIDKAPYTVQLRNASGYTICGGTLVTAQHVVTAAHCLSAYFPDELTVMAGVSTRSDAKGGEQRHIRKWFIHPRFNGYTAYADVAVIKLSAALTLDKNIAVVEGLCDGRLQENDLIQVSGWGRLYEDGPDSEEFRTVYLPITSGEQCTGPATAICAYAHGQDACVNDSGGPGIFQDQLCAIVSAGSGCARHNSPGLYTSIYAVRRFIERCLKA